MRKLLPRLAAAFALAVIAVPFAPAGAQTATAPLEVLIREVSFTTSGTTEITVSLAGSAVGNETLSGSNFSVTEGGTPVQGLTVAPLQSARRTAISVALVFDTSASIRGAALDAAKAAAKTMIGSLPAGTRTGIFTIGGPAARAADFTDDAGRLNATIDSLVATGRTSLYDGVVMAAREVDRQANTQRNVVILSDGEDTISGASLSDAVSQLRQAGSPVITVLLRGSSVDPASLRTLSNSVDGGRYLEVSQASALQSAFANVAQGLKTQYVLSYPATATTPNDLDISVTANVGGTSAADTSTVVNERTTAAAPPKPVDQPGPLIPLFGSSTGLYIGVFAAFAALLLFIAMLAYRPAGKRAEQLLARGLRLYTKSAQKKKKENEGGLLASTAAGRAAVGLVERVPRSKAFEEKMQKQLEQAGWPLRSTEFILLQVGGVAVGALLGFGLFARWWLGLLLMIVGALAPRVILSTTIAKRNSAFLEQLPDTLQLLAGSLQAGYGFMQALDTVSKESQAPTSTEFSRVLSEARLGMPIEEALDAMADRVGGEDFKWVVLAINIQRQVGGNLASLLTTVAQTLREREQVRRQIKVLSAEGRLSAIILVALPFVLVGYLQVVNPKYLTALTGETIGKIAIAMSLVLIGLGVVWMRKIIKIDV